MLDLENQTVDNKDQMGNFGHKYEDGKDRDGNNPAAGGGTVTPDPGKPDPGKPDPDKPGGDNTGGTGNTGGSSGDNGLTPTSLLLQVGSRTKDLVRFSLSYESDAVSDLKCDFNCSAKGLGISALSLADQKAQTTLSTK